MNPIPASAQTTHVWRLVGRTLPLSDRSRILGILNVTPDSFSDGGDWLSPAAAIRHGRQLAEEGADVVDVGGESTRPGAPEVPAEEELRRVLPVVSALAAAGILVSIDTRKAPVAEAALEAGAVAINDVSGGRFDPAMLPLAARTGAGLVLMHMRGAPATMRDHAVYADLIGEVRAELLARATAAEAAGVAREAIVLDPGIGFAKTAEQCFALVARFSELLDLPYPLLLGTSRKSFLAAVSQPPLHAGGGADRGAASAAADTTTGRDAPARERDLPTAATLVAGRLAGAALFRVHNVAMARTVLNVADRLREVRRP